MLNEQAESLARVLLPGGVSSGGYFCAGSILGERGVSLKVKLRGPDRGSWADYACDAGEPNGKGDMLKLIQLSQTGGNMAEALRWAKGWLGIESMDPAALERARLRSEAAQRRADAQRAGDIDKSRERARGLWMGAAPIVGTPAMHYLEGRGIDFAAIGRVPRALRFRFDVWNDDLKRKVPALLTAGCNLAGEHVMTHATYLHRKPNGDWTKLPDVMVDGQDGQRRPVKVAKKIFGRDWHGAHFAIHKPVGLGGGHRGPLRDMPAGAPLIISEGLEDALTGAMIHPGKRIVMAGTLGGIGPLEVPTQCGDVVILAQRDAPGSKAAASFEKQIAAQQARAATQGSGRRVGLLWPGEGFKDFNDELRGVRMT